MKQFKKIDFWISVVLLILFAMALVFGKTGDSERELKINILVFCFFLGIWQCLSMIIHFFKWRSVTYKNIRLFYALLAAIVLIFSFLTQYRIDEWPHAYFLPFMAIFYTCLCYRETFLQNKRSANSVLKITAIVIAIIGTAFTLHQYAKLIQHLISINYNWQFEFFMVVGMLAFQYFFIYEKPWSLKLEYYFNMLLVSLLGSLLLWPLIIINHFYTCSDAVNCIYFFTVVLIMFFVHKQRVAKLSLPVCISYTWVLYRFIILIFII